MLTDPIRSERDVGSCDGQVLDGTSNASIEGWVREQLVIGKSLFGDGSHRRGRGLAVCKAKFGEELRGIVRLGKEVARWCALNLNSEKEIFLPKLFEGKAGVQIFEKGLNGCGVVTCDKNIIDVN